MADVPDRLVVRFLAISIVLASFSLSVMGSELIFVFSRLDCRDELQVSEEELEFVRQLNHARVEGMRERIASRRRDEGDRESRARSRDALQFSLEGKLLDSLPEARRKRLRELVSQYCLRANRPAKILSESGLKLTKKEAETLSARFAELKPAAAEIRDVTTYQIRIEGMRRRLGKAKTDALVGERFEGQLPAFRDFSLPQSWREFVNVEPISFLRSSLVGKELSLTAGQVRGILKLEEEFEAIEKIAESGRTKYLESLPEPLRSGREHLERIEANPEMKARFAGHGLKRVLNLQREYGEQNDSRNARVREAVAGLLSEQQWKRLKQLIVQAGIMQREIPRALEIIGDDPAKMNIVELSWLQQESPMITASVGKQLYDLYAQAIVHEVGKRRFKNAFGARHTFDESIIPKAKRPNPRRQN